MTTQLSTGVIGMAQPAPTYIQPAALAVMAGVLLQGKREFSHMNYTPGARSSLAAALTAGIADPDILLQACADDTALEFGIRPTEFGVLAYTSRVVIVGFNASLAADRKAMTPLMQEREEQAARIRERTAPIPFAAPAGRVMVALDRDPYWAIFPWGLKPDVDNNTMSNWGLGVANLLNGQFANAIMLLQYASGRAVNIAAKELFWVRRALAANIALAVRYSREK